MEFEIEIYSTEEDKEPFTDWLDGLGDLDSQAVVLQRLQRIRSGNFGDCDPIQEGLWEFRIHFKSGFRIYYAKVGQRLVLIVGSGGKRGQQRDIDRALEHLRDYKQRRK